MAYPITQEALDLFTAPYRQVADITFNGTNDDLHITEKNIPLGGLSINRYSVSGSKIEIGSVVAAELSLSLDNSDGKFDDVTFEGAELFTRVGIKKWDAHRWENAVLHYIPMGYFTIDEAPRKLEKISLTALDRMVHFDKPVDISLLSFPMTVGGLLARICEICNITLGIVPESLTNHDYVVSQAPTDDDLTYRQILSWIAEITGTCGFIDWDGKLVLKWYEPTEVTITPAERHDSDLKENAITITGVQVVDGDVVHLAGDDAYAFNIEGNSLIQHDPDVVASALYSKLKGFSYTPFSASVKPMPHLYPLDGITFVDKHGVPHATIITDYTFTLNQATIIAGKGETAAKNGYAAMNPLTKRERIIVNKILPEINKTLDSRQQAVLELNETIANSFGLNRTEVLQPDGSTVYYFHNGSTLENSSAIYTFRGGGFAWTKKWDGDNTVWQYGVTKDGNAILNLLSVYKLTADHIQAGSITSSLLSSVYKDAVTDQINTAIKQTANSITSEVNKKVNDADFGTKITQNYASVRIAWNSISKYIEFADGSINIYSSTTQSSNNLLCKMTYTGTWYYHTGTAVGKIGTNNFTDDDNFKGLVFDLEANAKYMCWAAKDSDSDETYTVKLIYYNDSSKRPKGLHFACNTYCWNYLYINEHARTVNYTDGDAAWRSETHAMRLESGDTVVACEPTRVAIYGNSSKLVDCYNNIDMHNWDVLNQSDARLKKNIRTTQVNALDFISQVEMKEFDWIESGEHCDLGIIAQQLQEVAPHLVDENKDTGRLSIKINKFIPYLIKAIQELGAMLGQGNRNGKSTKWVDSYSDTEKDEFISANMPKSKPKQMEDKPIRLPAMRRKEGK